MPDRSLQSFADEVVAAEFRQPLKTIQEAVESIGWEFVDRPICCGEPVEVSSMIGPYFAECRTCGRFVRDITGPIFEKPWVCRTFDFKAFPNDTDWERSWIAGQREVRADD